MSLWIGSAPPPDALDLVGSAVHAAYASAPSFFHPNLPEPEASADKKRKSEKAKRGTETADIS